ncbi:unnamed protein product [Urochloa decumbens]|uniref:Polygalacturonase n=1 Tax=Urochloa decumbens TaxID=240449 RepID=A0ABC9H1M8_9POAL
MVETAGGRLHQRRGVAAFVAANKTLLAAAWVVGFTLVFLLLSAPLPPSRPAPRLRPTAYNLTDFGGVGDGRALNTEAFERAVEAIAALAERVGGQLNVPPGRWLTAPFNLTSHMTLFLAEGAEILGIPDEKYWPLMPALPSYGWYGQERKGPRFGSLIHGQNLKDVVITGYNGSINGQGEVWWMKHRRRMLNNTRPPLVQLMWSRDIIVANITLWNSPFWHFHPYDCTNVTVSNVTILSPVSGAPNTDGIDVWWSCKCYCRECPYLGIKERCEDKDCYRKRRYIRNISYHNITFDNVRAGIVIKVDYNEHADDGYDRTAFPDIMSVSFKGIHGRGVRVPVRAHGSDVIPIKDISFQDMSVGISYKKEHIFQCSYVEGRIIGSVFPKPCENLDLYNEQGQLVKQAVSLNSTELDYDI